MRDDARRTTRIIQIDEMLRGGAYASMEDLRFKFGVTQRTIERDFQRLRDEMNAPLEYDKERAMYHYTDPTYSIPHVVLTEGDLFTVSTVLPLMEQYENTPLENAFRRIMQKITAMLPEEITVNTSFLNKDITFLKNAAPVVEENVFNLIFAGVRSHKTAQFEYKSVGSTVFKQKEFDAYHVLCKNGNWYVIGFDHAVNDIRVYSLARIRKIVLTPKTFVQQKDFDLRHHVDLDFGIWNNPKEQEDYELLFDASMANYITERVWHKDQQIEEKDGGAVVLRFKSNQKEMIFTWVMGFGANVTVLKPKSLQDKIKLECQNLLNKYSS